jgi:phytoene desaturase
MPENKHIVVIGAGLGGLAVAARLARQGYKVTVFEKQDKPGGRSGIIQHDGFHFDTGPTLYLMPEVFDQTFSDLGRRREDYYELFKVNPNYRIHFHDGDSIVLQTDMTALQREMDRFEPGVFHRCLEFLAEGNYAYDISLKKFLGRNFRSLFEFFAPAHLPLMFQLRVMKKHYAETARYFHSDKLRRAMTFQTMYLGSSPFDSLATYTLLQYAEMVKGIYFPKGGVYAVVKALEHILDEEGVELVCDTPVQEISLVGHSVKGVILADGTHVAADAVVANADLPYVYDQLLPHPEAKRYAAGLKRKKYTSSAVMFYWGLDRRTEKELPIHHNIFLAEDYRGSFDQIFREYRAPVDPSFYVSAPTRTDPSYAPPGKESLVVLVPVGHLEDGVQMDWQQQTDHIKAHVLRRLADLTGLADLEKHIVYETVYTPRYYSEGLNLMKGSAFSLAHNFLQVGYFRPRNKADKFKNLYFVGGATHPGTGLPIVLISAKLTCERVIQGR